MSIIQSHQGLFDNIQVVLDVLFLVGMVIGL